MKPPAFLAVSCSTAYELAAIGELPTLRLRRRIVVPAAQLADTLGISLWKVASACVRDGLRQDDTGQRAL